MIALLNNAIILLNNAIRPPNRLFLLISVTAIGGLKLGSCQGG